MQLFRWDAATQGKVVEVALAEAEKNWTRRKAVQSVVKPLLVREDTRLFLEASENVAWGATSAMVQGTINAQKPKPLVMVLGQGSAALIHPSFVLIF